jgi:hypothetical protein
MSGILPSDIHAPLAATEYICSSLTERCGLIGARLFNLTAVFENYVAEIRLDGKAVHLALWDTAYVALHLSHHTTMLKCI